MNQDELMNDTWTLILLIQKAKLTLFDNIARGIAFSLLSIQ